MRNKKIIKSTMLFVEYNNIAYNNYRKFYKLFIYIIFSLFIASCGNNKVSRELQQNYKPSSNENNQLFKEQRMIIIELTNLPVDAKPLEMLLIPAGIFLWVRP